MKESGSPDVWVVVLNYRTPEMTLDAVHSLADEMRAQPGRRVLVVEGGSGDDSGERLRAGLDEEGLSDFAELLVLDENRGYAAGNNAAIRRALAAEPPPEFIHILNPDTVVRPGAVQALIDFLRKHPEAGLAGSRLEDLDGAPQHSAFRFPNLVNELSQALRFGPVTRLTTKFDITVGIPEHASEVDWVAGASLMVRTEVFRTVGLFDDGFFLYFEETDYCRKCALSGWKCWYVPESRVVHFVGGSTGLSDARVQRSRRPMYWYESRERYMERHFGSGRRRVADVLFAVGTVGYRARCRLLGKENSDPPGLLRDFLGYNFLGRREPFL